MTNFPSFSRKGSNLRPWLALYTLMLPISTTLPPFSQWSNVSVTSTHPWASSLSNTLLSGSTFSRPLLKLWARTFSRANYTMPGSLPIGNLPISASTARRNCTKGQRGSVGRISSFVIRSKRQRISPRFILSPRMVPRSQRISLASIFPSNASSKTLASTSHDSEYISTYVTFFSLIYVL